MKLYESLILINSVNHLNESICYEALAEMSHYFITLLLDVPTLCTVWSEAGDELHLSADEWDASNVGMDVTQGAA